MLEPRDEMILRMVVRRSSIQEMCAATRYSSTKSVHDRLRFLEQEGYILPPVRPKTARSRLVTQKGVDYLRAHNYLSEEEARVYINGARFEQRDQGAEAGISER